MFDYLKRAFGYKSKNVKIFESTGSDMESSSGLYPGAEPSRADTSGVNKSGTEPGRVDMSVAGSPDASAFKSRDKVREHLLFRGLVQGVGFRFRAKQEAKRLSLTGWVHNRMDGAVEAEVQGSEDRITEFIQNMRAMDYIEIDSVERKRIPVVPEKAFRVADYYF